MSHYGHRGADHYIPHYTHLAKPFSGLGFLNGLVACSAGFFINASRDRCTGGMFCVIVCILMRLSPSTLNLFLECPRCFWCQINKGIHRPQGPFPSLPGGMDILIKKYFDEYRLRGALPPELVGKVDAQLFADIEVLNKWRNWRTGLAYADETSGAVLSGALDDCLVKDGFLIPMDYKTRGFDVKVGGEAFYQNQMNCYSLLLEKNGMRQPQYAWLMYWIPREIVGQAQPRTVPADMGSGAWVYFSVEPKKVTTNSEDALKTFRSAVALLDGPLPASHSACAFCGWGTEFLTD